MTMMRATAFALLVACGARSTVDDLVPGVDAGPIRKPIDATAPPQPPKDASGLVVDKGNSCYVILDVRVCGAKCSAYDCCTPLFDKNGNRVDIGVCWIDRGDNGMTPCTSACDDCVWRAPGKSVCAPKYFCAALAELGASAACAKK